jgi:deazaflavin-dependent oxidoreductase (nitroreductase family)
MSSRNDWNKDVIEEFRANEGRVGGHFENMTLLLLHTVGAKSGHPRLNPVATIADGERYVIIASKAGAATNPDWYHNIIANPEVRVELGTEMFEARACLRRVQKWCPNQSVPSYIKRWLPYIQDLPTMSVRLIG